VGSEMCIRDSDMTGPRNAQFVHDAIASLHKQIVLLDDCYHVITVDRQRQAVVTHLAEFFKLNVSTTHRIEAQNQREPVAS
jgi:esterase/lipase